MDPVTYSSSPALDGLADTPKNRAFVAAVRSAVKRYENTGVRIEDDYVITENGLERIRLVPREAAEIEAPMRERHRIQPYPLAPGWPSNKAEPRTGAAITRLRLTARH